MQEDKLFGPAELPKLPSNACYVFHENKCYDWGTFGWAIHEGKVDTSAYRHIIFMNSSVRGPFLPPYFPVSPQPSALMQLCSAIVSPPPQTQCLHALYTSCTQCTFSAYEHIALMIYRHWA